MHTLRLTPDHLQAAANILRSGGLVAMPTETVYGLGANALNPASVEKIFTAKDRPHWDPLIIHISDTSMLAAVTRSIPSRAQTLMDRFWPGPLTLLLPRNPALPPSVTAGRDLVGVRMPAHPVALALIRAAGVPIAAPSANRFGHISPTSAAHVLADLDGRIDAVLDAGSCSIGLESTVLDPGPSPMVLYRQGGISLSEITAAAGPAVAFIGGETPLNDPQSLPSPGVGIRHYAPRARLHLVDSPSSLALEAAAYDTSATGLLLPEDWPPPRNFAGVLFHWGRWSDPAALAATLYEGLRTLDATPGITTILCPVPALNGNTLADAIRDRLLKAAQPR